MKKDVKGNDGGHKCGTCSWVMWVLPIVLLAVALIDSWYMASWGKWVIVAVAALYIIKNLKPCKACMAM